MIENDPMKKMETLVRDMHDTAAAYTQPVLARYPLTFAFLLAFSLAAFLHGFELIVERVPLFRENPWLLVGLGALGLFVTGSLYKSLMPKIN